MSEATRLGHRLESAGLRALAPEVAAAQARPDGADPVPALTTLLALRQLHADAASLRDEGSRRT